MCVGATETVKVIVSPSFAEASAMVMVGMEACCLARAGVAVGAGIGVAVGAGVDVVVGAGVGVAVAAGAGVFVGCAPDASMHSSATRTGFQPDQICSPARASSAVNGVSWESCASPKAIRTRFQFFP